jgi:hypothetical protein
MINSHRGPNKGYGWSASNPKAATYSWKYGSYVSDAAGTLNWNCVPNLLIKLGLYFVEMCLASQVVGAATGENRRAHEVSMKLRDAKSIIHIFGPQAGQSQVFA